MLINIFCMDYFWSETVIYELFCPEQCVLSPPPPPPPFIRASSPELFYIYIYCCSVCKRKKGGGGGGTRMTILSSSVLLGVGVGGGGGSWGSTNFRGHNCGKLKLETRDDEGPCRMWRRFFFSFF